jgi:glyoxylase-like metal-dependent hydrolase (beta-lactamase superfamily II)
MKTSWLSIGIYASLAFVTKAIPMQECIDDFLPARVACYDTDGPCDLLPVADESFPTQPLGENGYGIQLIRSSPTTHVYTVTEGAYFMMVALDLPKISRKNKLRGLKEKKFNAPEEGAKLKGSTKKGSTTKGSTKKGSTTKGSTTKGSTTKESTKNGKNKGAKKGSDMEEEDDGKVSVAIFDFPEGSFVVRDATGAASGSLITKAIDEIVFEIEGFDIADIADVSMVYSHAHFDHIGAATITYNHILDNWGIDSVIIATEPVKEHFERQIQRNFFSFRAPVPTETFTGKSMVQVGESTTFHLEQTDGHSGAARDMIIFLEKDGDYPAIMMIVDVVFPKWAPFFDLALAADVGEYLFSHETLLSYPLGDDGIFVAGHLSILGDRSDIEVSYEFAKDVLEAAGFALATVDIVPIASGSGYYDPNSDNYFNSWNLFNEYLSGGVSNVCAKRVVEKWGCKLGGLDVTIKSGCDAAQTYYRIDY